MKVKICDMIMGAGKTESAISLMNEDIGHKYIYITPYLKELERIKESCASRHFQDPKYRTGGKLEGLHSLLRAGQNIVSTHALFGMYTDETIELIRAGDYHLIMDEVHEVVDVQDLKKSDLEILIKSRVIEVDENHVVHWIKEDYSGKFEKLKNIFKTNYIILHKNSTLIRAFNPAVFRAFQSVTILTFMFDAQVQKYYFDLSKIEYEKIGTVKENGQYHFCTGQNVPDYISFLPEKIHIFDSKKLNQIGSDPYALSYSWFHRPKNRNRIKQLKNNVTNIMRNIYHSRSDQIMWTVFKDCKEKVQEKGYTKGFLEFNIRATNQYRDRDHLAYCVNIFFNPHLKNFFEDHGVSVNEDEYALSVMVQWIWRSAIRDGEDIWIYVPSIRMRELLTHWLDSLKKDNANHDNAA